MRRGDINHKGIKGFYMRIGDHDLNPPHHNHNSFESSTISNYYNPRLLIYDYITTTTSSSSKVNGHWSDGIHELSSTTSIPDVKWSILNGNFHGEGSSSSAAAEAADHTSESESVKSLILTLMMWCSNYQELISTKLSEGIVIISVILLVIINTLVIAGNILVILAVFASQKLRTSTNYFIVSLAVADLLVGLAVLPYSLTFEVLDVWIFGEIWCQGWLVVDVWMCTASILNLCAISVDRYLAVTRPVKYRSMMTGRRAKMVIAAVWLLSFLICFPPLVGWNGNRTSFSMSFPSSTTTSSTTTVSSQINDNSIDTIIPNFQAESSSVASVSPSFGDPHHVTSSIPSSTSTISSSLYLSGSDYYSSLKLSNNNMIKKNMREDDTNFYYNNLKNYYKILQNSKMIMMNESSGPIRLKSSSSSSSSSSSHHNQHYHRLQPQLPQPTPAHFHLSYNDDVMTGINNNHHDNKILLNVRNRSPYLKLSSGSSSDHPQEPISGSSRQQHPSSSPRLSYPSSTISSNVQTSDQMTPSVNFMSDDSDRNPQNPAAYDSNESVEDGDDEDMISSSSSGELSSSRSSRILNSNMNINSKKNNNSSLSPNECETPVTQCTLFNDKGYVIYSALGSFYIPMLFMFFFYWKIYLVASRTTKALKRGYRSTKASKSASSSGNNDERFTLRIHRGFTQTTSTPAAAATSGGVNITSTDHHLHPTGGSGTASSASSPRAFFSQRPSSLYVKKPTIIETNFDIEALSGDRPENRAGSLTSSTHPMTGSDGGILSQSTSTKTNDEKQNNGKSHKINLAIFTGHKKRRGSSTSQNTNHNNQNNNKKKNSCNTTDGKRRGGDEGLSEPDSHHVTTTTSSGISASTPPSAASTTAKESSGESVVELEPSGNTPSVVGKSSRNIMMTTFISTTCDQQPEENKMKKGEEEDDAREEDAQHEEKHHVHPHSTHPHHLQQQQQQLRFSEAMTKHSAGRKGSSASFSGSHQMHEYSLNNGNDDMDDADADDSRIQMIHGKMTQQQLRASSGNQQQHRLSITSSTGGGAHNRKSDSQKMMGINRLSPTPSIQSFNLCVRDNRSPSSSRPGSERSVRRSLLSSAGSKRSSGVGGSARFKDVKDVNSATPGNLSRRSNTGKWQAKRFQAETKAAKTVGIIIGGFIICWFPFFTAYLIRAFCTEPSSCIPELLMSIFTWLGYCNSAINPIIYGLFSRDFRRAFKNIICRCTFRDEVGVSSLIRQIHMPTFLGDEERDGPRNTGRHTTTNTGIEDLESGAERASDSNHESQRRHHSSDFS